MRLVIFSLISIFLSGCKMQQPAEKQFFDANNKNFTYTGRTFDSDAGRELIASAASVKAEVFGDTVTVFLQAANEQHHYVAVELNNEYVGRFRVLNDSIHFALPNQDSPNTLTIFKETEASNGAIIFTGLKAENIEKPKVEERAKIEFIGDSITCGMGADTSEIDCDEGEWFDQHNAYMSYGPRVARALDVDFEINCVSGMGMYRNWNDEDQPVMPDVYSNLRLNTQSPEKANVENENAPDIVSIALGTNDFSLGDGEKMRTPFDAEKFKNNYSGFIDHIFRIYPETKVALISSPMTGEAEGKEMTRIFKEIKNDFADKPIKVFEFEKMEADGCTGHPGVEDHQIMAGKLIPFYRDLLNK